MANKTINATASLFLNTKEAQKDAQRFVADLKQKLNEIESASDKVSVFKDMVGYIAQVDKALTMLKANNADMFNTMFGGLDASLKQQLEGLFGIDGSKLGKIDILREKLNTLTPKSSIKDVRIFAKEINTLFDSIGIKRPFENIDEMFSGRVTTEHLKTLGVELANFATIWEGVSARVSKGFGGSGSGSGVVGGLSDEVQSEINKLEKQKQEYLEILDVFNGKKIKIQIDKRNDADALKSLTLGFKDAKAEMDRLEASGMKGGEQYYRAVAQYTKAASLVKNAFDYVAEHGSNKGIAYTLDPAALDIYDEAERHLDSYLQKNKSTVEQIKGLYSNLVADTNTKLEQIKEPSSTTGDQNLKTKISIYDELKNKVQEYYALNDKINNDDNLSDKQTDELYKQVDALDRYFLALDKTKSKQSEIRDLLGNLAFGDVDSQTALQKFCDLLGMQIPKAAEVASSAIKAVVAEPAAGDTAGIIENVGSAAESSKTKVDALTESLRNVFMQSTELELKGSGAKETMSLLRTDGTISNAVGINQRVDTDTIVGQLIANLKDNMVMSLHNHANGNDMFSPQDIESFAKLYYGQGTKINGIIADGMIKTIDFTGISQEVAIKIAKSYSDGIQNIVSKNSNLLKYTDGHVDYTDFVKGLSVTNPDAYKDIILATQSEINECLNNAFVQNGVQPTIKQFEHSQIPELSKQLIQIQENAQGTLTPVEKLKNLLATMYPDKTFNWSNYTEIFDKFNSGAIDGSKAIDKILNFENISSQVDQAKSKVQELHQVIGTISKSGNKEAEDANNVLNTVKALNQKTLSYEELTNAVNAYINAVKYINTHGEDGISTKMETARDSIRQKFSYANMSGDDWANLSSGKLSVEQFVARLEEAQTKMIQIKETTRSFDNYVGALDDNTYSWDKIKGSYNAVMQGIKDGTFKTVDECIAKFNQLTTSLQAPAHQGAPVAGGSTGVSAQVSGEAAQLDTLKAKLEEVRAAVDAKTSAFEKESSTVGAAVNAELEALQTLLNKLVEIASQVATINAGFSQMGQSSSAVNHIGKTDSATAQSNTTSSTSVQSYALDATLANTNNILSSILDAVNNNSSLSDFVSKLQAAVDELKNAAGEIKEAKKIQLTNRSVGAGRIANNYGQLSSIASNFALADGTESAISGMKVLADGLTVRVEGAIKSASGAWKGFTTDIDQFNNVINHSINEQSSFAQSLNETATKAQDVSAAVKDVSKAPVNDKFATALNSQKQAFNDYRNGLNNVDYMTDELKADLNDLGESLKTVTNQKDLETWAAGFNVVKRAISQAKSEFTTLNTGTINLFQKELTKSYGKLDRSQKEDLSKEYLDVIAILERYKASVKEGQAVELAGIKEITAALQEKIDKLIEANKQSAADKTTKKKNESFGSTAYINALAKYNTLKEQVGAAPFANSTETQTLFAQYENAYNALIAKRNQLMSQDVITEEEKADFKAITTECNNYATALDRLLKNSASRRSKAGDGGIYMLGQDVDPKDAAQMHEHMNNLASSMSNGKAKLVGFNDVQRTATYEFKNANNEIQRLTVEYDNGSHALVGFTSQTKHAKTATQEFLTGLGQGFRNVARYLATFGSVYRIFSTLRKGFNYVKEIDVAMTELKKVTNETDEAYSNFLTNASKRAANIGSKLSDFTNATAAFARLGYDLDESSKMAETAIVYKNVADGLDSVDEATDSIISTMMAYGIAADDTMSIIDRFNEVKFTCLLMQ